jgi:hypothetical protein
MATPPMVRCLMTSCQPSSRWRTLATQTLWLPAHLSVRTVWLPALNSKSVANGPADANCNGFPCDQPGGLPDKERKVVFVANLAYHLSEGQVRCHLARVFRNFRIGFMSVHLNSNTPYTFVEFKVLPCLPALAFTANVSQTEQEAKMAQKQCYGADVGGRPIRTELADANSTGFLSRHDGDAITTADLESAFENIPVRKTWTPTNSDFAAYRLSRTGRFVDFEDHASYTRALKVNIVPVPSHLFLLKPNLTSSSETGSLQHLSFRPGEKWRERPTSSPQVRPSESCRDQGAECPYRGLCSLLRKGPVRDSLHGTGGNVQLAAGPPALQKSVSAVIRGCRSC